MTTAEARKVMAEHYRAHDCSKDSTRIGCTTAEKNYANYLTAVAEEAGFDPESFPGVRSWMRANGHEPKPMDEAWKKGRTT